MYTKEYFFQFIGNPGEVTLEYIHDSKKLEIIWPDKTRYEINGACIDNIEEIKKQIISGKNPYKTKISNINFNNILAFEFKKLLLEFSLLPIKSVILSDKNPITDPYAIYLTLDQQDEILILIPHIQENGTINFKTEKLSKTSKLISQKSYQDLQKEIKQNKTHLSIPDALKHFIRDQNIIINQMKSQAPNLENIDCQGIEGARQRLLSVKDIDDLQLTDELEKIEKLLSSEKEKFLKDNSIDKIKGQEENIAKISRLHALTNFLQNKEYLKEYLSIVNEFLNIKPEITQSKPESKPKASDSKISQSYNEDLVMGDATLLTDKQIQKIANVYLSESKLAQNSYTFDSLVVTDKHAPHGLYEKIKLFRKSSEIYQMFAVNHNNIHWVYVFCYKDSLNQIKAIYVDSMTPKNCDDLSSQMLELGVDMQFHHLECQKDGYNCGAWVLNFLEKTIGYIEKHPLVNRDELLEALKTKTNITEKRIAYKTLHNQGIDKQKASSISYDLEQDLLEIEKFHSQIEHLSSLEITEWAIKIRQKDPQKLSHQDLLQAIAYLDRCFCINSGGNRLRDCQKQAILNFFNRTNIGHISQINTGEGKTTIVACVQALKVLLQGYKGYVFTSNCVLAEEGVTKNQNFYQDLNITVAHNNPDETYMDGPKACYAADIVYGTINNFQFDWLRHEFECQNTMGDDFDFDKCWAMLDEIDSLLIDQGGNLAKLSVPFPGMSSLEMVYLTIWENLLDCTDKYPDSQAVHKHFTSKENETLLEAKLNLLIEQGKVPIHLKKYLKLQLSNWISSAFCAYFVYEKNVQYNIEVKDGAPNILPVDNQNTGVSMHNTVLCNGLHQFLQLKHGLAVTFESPTSSFVSNIGFVQKFANKISGVTGTAGEQAEKSLLQQKINLEFSIIPPFQKKKFALYDGMQIDDPEFITTVATHALSETLQGQGDEVYNQTRSSLIICSSVKDVDDIHKAILELAKQAGLAEPKIRLFRDEREAKVTELPIETGEIVIATNIAGRGTDFHTSQQLEQHGGLHVIEAFLPCNQRVQDQGFGRTARQGKSGTGQMIIRSSEVSKLPLPEEYDFDDIIKARDIFEQQRLEEIKKTKLAELEYHDKLFNSFSNLYQEIKKQHQHDSNKKWHFVLKDLKEKWAMWLVEHVFEQHPKSNVDEEFEKFRQQALPIINGEIHYNPFYVIQLAETFLKDSSSYREPAKKQLLRLIESDSTDAFNTEQVNKEMLYQAYMLLFEIDIDDGNQTLKRFQKAIGKLFNIPFAVNNDYLVQAKKHLELAKKIIEIKIADLKNLLEDSEEKKCTIQKIINKSIYFEHENNLGKHFASKLTILDVHHQKIDHLLQQVEEFKESGATLEKSHHHIAKTLKKNIEEKKQEDDLAKIITPLTLKDHMEEGGSTICELKPVHDVPEHVLTNAKIQIGAGLGLLGLALWFPICSPVIGPLGGAMISEGITDIIFSLFDQSEFSHEDYVKSKLISYGIALATMGIGAILQCTKMVRNAIDSIRKLAKRLNDATGAFAKIKQQIGALLDKVANKLEKMLFMAQNAAKQAEMLTEINNQGYHKQFNQLSKIKKTVDLTPYQQIQQIFSGALKDGIKDAAFDLAKDKLLNPALKALMANLKTHLKEKIEEFVKQYFQDPNPSLRVYSEKQISDAIQMIFNYSNWNDGEIVRKIGLGIAKSHSDWMAQLASFAIETVISGVEISQYTQTICHQLQDKMSSFEKQTQLVDEHSYQKLLQQFSEQITDGLFSKVVSLTQQVILEVPKVAKKAHQYYKQKKVEKLEVAPIEARNQQIEDGIEHAKQAGTNCVSHGLSHVLELDEHTVNHGLDLLPSEHGIAKSSFECALNVLGKTQHVIEKPKNEADIIREIEKHQSDRGLLILDAQTDMQHVVGIKKGKDNQWFCHAPEHENPIELTQFLAQKGSSNIEQLRIIEGLNASNIIAAQHKVRQNYLALASQPIKKQLHESGLMFAGKPGNTAPQVADKKSKPVVIEMTKEENLKVKLNTFIALYEKASEQKLEKAQSSLQLLNAEKAKLENIDKADGKSKQSIKREKQKFDTDIEKCQKEIEIEQEKLSKVKKEIIFTHNNRSLDLSGTILDDFNSDKQKLIEGVKKITHLPSGNNLTIEGNKKRTYRFEFGINKRDCYELQRNGKEFKGLKTTVGVVHYDHVDLDIIDTPQFQLKLEFIKSGIIKSIENFKAVDLMYQEIKPQPQKTNKGLGFFSSTRNTKYDYWYDYQPNGLTHLLNLRLKQRGIDEENFSIACPWEIEKCNLKQVKTAIIEKRMVSYICLPILVPQDEQTNHWVGVVFIQKNGLIHAKFVDSENQVMSDTIQKGIEQLASEIDGSAKLVISQELVPTQNYNNCGLELIENITQIITGSRQPESLVLEHHQKLYLQDLLINSPTYH